MAGVSAVYLGPMKIFLLVALLFPVLSGPAFSSEGKLREWIDSASWSQGVEYCDQKLAVDLSRRPDVRSLSAEHLSRIATYCAALASGQGDEFSTGWWWYTAAALHLKTAQDLLPELRKLGLLQTLPAPRSRIATSVPLEKAEKDKVQLLSGEVVSGTPPRPLTKPKPPKYLFTLGPGVVSTDVGVEMVVSRDGLPRQPLLTGAQALPVHVFFAYRFFSTWRFEPARVDNEPVDSVYRMSLSTKRVH
jgi:hypothetical protein